MEQVPLVLDDQTTLPTIEARSPSAHPFLFRKRLGDFPIARPGQLVRVTLNEKETLGYGLFNPHAEIAVRLLRWGLNAPDIDWWTSRINDAVHLRRQVLQLDQQTDAYRVIHAEGDGLPGLVVDRFGDVLVVEAYALGMYQRAEALLDLLLAPCDSSHGLLRAAPQTDLHEGFDADPVGSADLPDHVVIQEFGTKFRVEFAGHHKTGFYCDQRNNRRRLSELCAGKSVLDLCCYTGGFSLQAARLGNAAKVTGVELDEMAVGLARTNAKLNKLPIEFVQADAFAYLRDMQRNGRTFDVVILDPPKLIRSRDEFDAGRHKYYDFNRLAMELVAPGGLMMTCSCSGLLPRDEFLKIVSTAPRLGRRVQILEQGGAAPDHPIATNCPETEYLKTVLMRLE